MCTKITNAITSVSSAAYQRMTVANLQKVINVFPYLFREPTESAQISREVQQIKAEQPNYTSSVIAKKASLQAQKTALETDLSAIIGHPINNGPDDTSAIHLAWEEKSSSESDLVRLRSKFGPFAPLEAEHRRQQQADKTYTRLETQRQDLVSEIQKIDTQLALPADDVSSVETQVKNELNAKLGSLQDRLAAIHQNTTKFNTLSKVALGVAAWVVCKKVM